MANELETASGPAPAALCDRIARLLARIVTGEEAVTAIEYGLLAALIVLVASGAIALMGGGVTGLWTLVSTAVNNAI
jgi:Flp pilus assembly pilin Flp